MAIIPTLHSSLIIFKLMAFLLSSSSSLIFANPGYDFTFLNRRLKFLDKITHIFKPITSSSSSSLILASPGSDFTFLKRRVKFLDNITPAFLPITASSSSSSAGDSGNSSSKSNHSSYLFSGLSVLSLYQVWGTCDTSTEQAVPLLIPISVSSSPSFPNWFSEYGWEWWVG